MAMIEGIFARSITPKLDRRIKAIVKASLTMEHFRKRYMAAKTLDEKAKLIQDCTGNPIEDCLAAVVASERS